MKINKQNKKCRLWAVPVLCILVFAVCFLIYTGHYYHADASCKAALKSDESVSVTQTGYGWLFDGPSESDALIFYPGGKVEETSYAPLLHLLAQNGMDVCLVKMPFRLAVFGAGKANDLIAQYDYDHWYIGGHSLGGAMAASYAAENSTQLTGVVLLAAYPIKKLDESLSVTVLYGSEDGVLNREKLTEGEAYLPQDTVIEIIAGGNHAQFGNYGIQKGDGNATITAGEQQRQTEELIIQRQAS